MDKTFASTEAKDKWGLIADTALRQPVTITKHGRATLVVTSVEDYQSLQRLKYAQLKSDIAEGIKDLAEGRTGRKSVDDLIREGKRRIKKSRG